MPRESESLHERVGYKSVIDMGREATVPFPHNLCDYPTKILPQVMGEFVERLSAAGEVVLDPFAGGGTVAVECALRQRRSVNIDINPYALEVAQKKLAALRTGSLFESPLVETQVCLRADARALPIRSDSVDAIVTDIPYADMIRYSDLPADLSTIEDYDAFLDALAIAFDEVNYRRLKPTASCRHDAGVKPTSLRARSKPSLRIKIAELMSRCDINPQQGQQCRRSDKFFGT
jgi:hypothetical protein